MAASSECPHPPMWLERERIESATNDLLYGVAFVYLNKLLAEI